MLKAIEQNLSKNEVSKMDVNGKKRVAIGITDPLAITRPILGKLTSRNEVLKALEAKLNESEVSGKNINNRRASICITDNF